MYKIIKLIYLLVLLSLHLSCFEKKAPKHPNKGFELTAIPQNNNLTFTSGIRAIFQDSKGKYWIGSHREGIAVLTEKTWKYLTTLDGLPDNQIRSIQEDQSGNIWISTSKGASVYNNGKLITYVPNFNAPKYHWHETQGDLWFFGGNEDGIMRFDGKNMNYLIFPKPQNRNPADVFGVTGISKDNKGKVWIATYAALFSFDGKTVNSFDTKKLNLHENEQLHIRSVLADSKGRVWIGNNGIGVLLMEGDSVIHFSEANKLIHPTSKRRGDKSLPGTLEHVFASEEDSYGNIWFADRDTGAWKFDGKTLTNYSIDPKLNSQFIWCIYEDPAKNLLFGMAEGGVYQFNGKTFDKLF
ncbi:MAG: diguanylate cyclase [Bacteroidia bacterium]|nr:diguanylate cyclase [Bacteroidia bacterium]